MNLICEHVWGELDSSIEAAAGWEIKLKSIDAI